MPAYETIFAMPSNLSEEERNQGVKEVEKRIEEASGTVKSSEGMGEKRMAYKVKGHELAYYHLIKFDCPPKGIEVIKVHYRNNSNRYIRNMLVKEEI